MIRMICPEEDCGRMLIPVGDRVECPEHLKVKANG